LFFKHIIKYSQCWEDTDVLVSALLLEDDDVVLSITSGGDNSLALSGFTKKKTH
jgi:S-adenosylmethionine-diacylglycerol 3-amino-3-carboxypropyl transferase